MFDFASLALISGISLDPIRPAAFAVLANIQVLAVVGALGYGVFLWGLSSPRGFPFSWSALTGLVMLGGAFAGQIWLVHQLRGDEIFRFGGIMMLFLLGMWLVSLVVCILNPSLRWMMVNIMVNGIMIVPVLLVMGYANSLP